MTPTPKPALLPVSQEELLPCPLCGQSVEGKEGYDYNQTLPRRYWITCYRGYHEAAVDYPFAQKAEAITAWNTRATPAPTSKGPGEVEERARELLRKALGGPIPATDIPIYIVLDAIIAALSPAASAENGLREAVQHLLDVGEFCRTDDTESALRRVRAALNATPSQTAENADGEHVENDLLGALKREIIRQCSIGAGCVSEDVETGLISVNADLDPHGLRKVLSAQPKAAALDREAVARIIDPNAWEWAEDHERRAQEWSDRGHPDDHALVGGYRAAAKRNVLPSLAKADRILALIGETA